MEDLLYQEIGKRIKSIRKSKGWTQEDLGELVGLTRTSITNVELGRQRIQIHVLYKFAVALGCDERELLPTAKQIVKSSDKVKLTIDVSYLKPSEVMAIKSIYFKSKISGGEFFDFD